MFQGFGVLKFFMLVCGETKSSHKGFMDRLKKRVPLQGVSSEDESDVIIAFVPITSRSGTDIRAALQKIPHSPRPVVLVVLHHTFDKDFIAPDSSYSVDRSNVFTVDCLFQEDQGLLKCLRNDMALKAVTDHLISKGATEESMTPPNPRCPWSPRRTCVWIFILCLCYAAVTGIIVFLIVHFVHQ